jgi:hypothetical protein
MCIKHSRAHALNKYQFIRLNKIDKYVNTYIYFLTILTLPQICWENNNLFKRTFFNMNCILKVFSSNKHVLQQYTNTLNTSTYCMCFRLISANIAACRLRRTVLSLFCIIIAASSSLTISIICGFV